MNALPASGTPAPASFAALRALFPYAAERVYLDTAAAGLTWAGHGAAVARFFDDVKSRGFDARPEWLAMAQRVRTRLAAWLGVGADDVTFVSNTTEGLNLAALSLPLGRGHRIVLAADEFPSVARCWQAAERAGAAIVRVDVPHEALREARLLEAAGPGTTVLAVSQTHWSTGTTLDLAAIGAHCRAQGTLFVVDGMQALGAVPVRLAGIDVFAASFFKWMLSGFGIGVLVTSAAARARMVPALLGYANEGTPGALQYAHVNMPAIYGLDATLDVLESIGWPALYARVAELGTAFADAAAQRGLELVTPRGRSAGIQVVRAADAERVRERLGERGISVSARGAGVRVSPHVYNTEDEVVRCADALAGILPLRG